MAKIPRVFATLMPALAILVCSTQVLSAQGSRPMVPDLRSSTTLGLGYVASVPNAYVGFSALVLTPKLLGGAGVYADVKLTGSTPGKDPYFRGDISVEQAEVTNGDLIFDRKSVWVSVNLAFAYAVTRELGLYAGGGYSRERRYREYFDLSQTRGFEGFYWILDEAASGNRVNALGGVLLRAASHFVIQVGAETRPLGGNVGVMFTLPF